MWGVKTKVYILFNIKIIMENILREIGLNETEIKIYTTLLKIGESKSGEIIKEGKIKSGRVYESFDSLIGKGLISYSMKSGVKYFVAADPKNLYRYLDKKKDEIDFKKNKLKTILPNILSSINYSKRAVVEVYEGIDGMENAFDKELKYNKREELLCFGVDPTDTYSQETIDFFVYNLFKQREKFKIRKLFGEKSRGDKTLVENNSKIKFMKDDSLATIDIINNLILIHLHHGKNVVISIEDKELAESMREQFNYIWKNASASEK